MKRMRLGDLVLVEWFDAFGSGSGWNSVEHIKKQSKPWLVRTVGWVLGVTDDYLVLGSCISLTDGDVAAVSHIPIVCIRGETNLGAKHRVVYQPPK